MKKLLITTIAGLVSLNANAYNITDTLTVSVNMASAITFNLQPNNIAIPSLVPGESATTGVFFNVDGDNSQTMVCSLSGIGISGESSNNAILYRDSDDSNTGDTIVASLGTECFDSIDSLITLHIEASDTDAADIGKVFGVDGNVTLTVAYQ